MTAVTEAERQRMRAMKATHWFMRVFSKETAVIVELPKADTKNLVFGFFPPDMLHGARIYLDGAVDADAAGCKSVVATPFPGRLE